MKIEQLSPGQRDELLRRARERLAGALPEPRIERRRDPDAPVPLSFSQQRLWFLDRLVPDNVIYNIPIAVQVDGDLRIDLLWTAFEELFRRHETLRTSFVSTGGEPFQVISRRGKAFLPIVDLSGLSPALRSSAARALCTAEGMRSFDLAAGPLLRSTLFRLAEDRYVLLLVFHHIISDLWSFGVFVREMTLIYDSLLSGKPHDLPELPIQYPDFALWQREQLQGELLEQEVDYWRRELAGAPLLLFLPLDRPRPPILDYNADWVSWVLPAEITERLRSLGLETGATLFMTLLSTFSLLLSRHCTQEDLIVGAPVANRMRTEVEGLIGIFVNLLVLRADLTGRPNFRELLERTTEKCVNALNHQELPFENLVDSLGLDRDLSQPPLVQAALAFQNVSLPSVQRSDLRFTYFDFDFRRTKFDLAIDIKDLGHVLEGTFGYNVALLDQTTVQRISHHFRALLEGISTDPDCPVGELPMLTEAERHLLVREWSLPDFPQDGPRDGNVVERVWSIARRSPAAAAAVWNEGALSYGDLLARSSRIAAGLRSLGVGPDVPVGVVLERSPDLLVGMMSVLAAGGACLFLDPGRDRSWLEKALERSGAPVVLTQKRLASRMPEHGAREVYLERLEEPGAPLDAFFGEDAPPASLAFVIRASGDRRIPRLSGLEHRSVIAWVRSWEQRLRPEHLARVETASALGTVDSVFDLIVPLCLGGCLALDDAGEAASLLSATPSQISARLRHPAAWRAPRAVRSFGEPLDESLRRRLTKAGVERVYDSYSSASGGVWAWDERSGAPRTDGDGGEVPVYILDRAGEPAPIGVPGELCLSWGGAARGYLGDPELTSARFIPDRFGGGGDGRHGRLVRTGDLARRRSDGSLQLLPGVREVSGQLQDIAPAESLLMEHPGVLQAVARVQQDEVPARLVVYALTRVHAAGASPAGPTEEELLAYLRERLPGPRVPRRILLVEELPLTFSGRVDRENLPPVPQEATDQIAPRTEMESLLATAWCELLQRDSIGVRENFFRLGGHSLLAVRLMSRIESELGLEIPLSDLFQAPTIERLAARIQTSSKAPSPSVLVSIQPHGARPPLFFVHPVGGSVFCYRELAQHLGPEQPFFGLQNEGVSREGTLEDMAERYVGAVRDLQPQGPYFLGGWSLGAVIAFEMARQLRDAGAAVALVAMVDAPPAKAEERRLGPLDEDAWLLRFAIDLLGVQAVHLSAFLPEALALGPEARLERLLELAQRKGILPSDLTLPHFLGRYELFRHNLEVLFAYEARPLSGSLLFLPCESGLDPRDPLRGWGELARGGAECHPLPGDHYSILQTPNVLALADRLKAGIEEGVQQEARFLQIEPPAGPGPAEARP